MKYQHKIHFTLTRDEINQAIAEFAARQLDLEDLDTAISINFSEGYIDIDRTIKDIVSASGAFILSK